MGQSLQLVWDLIARDSASPTFARVGASAEGAAAGVGKLLGGFSALAVGGAVAASIKAASDFQAKMLLIQTQAGATSDEVKKMTPAILSLAGQVAQAPEALATSLYHVESTGLRGAQALEAVKIAAEGAKVGHADLEQTTNALTATIASGMLPATETYAQAMGQLNTIVGSGDMKMQDLNDALSSGLLVITKQYGVGINDVGAALATFGDNNVRGADAATMLRMAVQAIAKPGKDAAGALGQIGLTVGQLQSDEQTGGLNKALTDLHDHLLNSGIDASKWGELLTTAFTKKAGSGLITLVGQFDRFQQKYEEVSKGADGFGNAWAATTKTANFQFAQLGNSVEALGIHIGTGLLPYVSDLAKNVSQFLSSRGFKDFLDTTGAAAVTAGHAIGGLVQGFVGLPAPVKEAAAAFVLLRLADHIGLLEKIGTGAGAVGSAFRNFAADVSATRGVLETANVPLSGFSATLQTTAERGMGALKSAGQGVLNMMGGPWGAGLLGATVAVGSITSAIQQAKQTQQDWTNALEQGGQAAADATRAMQAQSAQIQHDHDGFMGFINTIDGYNLAQKAKTSSTQDATKAAQDHYNSLGLVDQKSLDLTNAQYGLSQALKNNSADSLAVRDAEDKVRTAQGDLKVATDELNQSTKTSAQLSQEQATNLLALSGSSLAVKQSYDEFQSSYQQLLSDQAKGQLSTAQLTNEQDALNSSALNVANSAGLAGSAWAKSNGVTDTATASQYAQLLALQKVADAMGTNTPASIKTLIASLQASVSQGHLTAAQMDGITSAVDGIPGQKKIDVTADTSQAQNQINSLLGMYQHVQYTGSAIVVNGRVVANADGNLLEAFAAGGMSPMSSSVATVVKPGTLRVIGDNPVADEAFIPINKSARSMQILGETASRMGLGLHAMADGGMFSRIPWSVNDRFGAQASQAMLDSAKALVSFAGGSAGGNAGNRALGQRIANAMGVGGQFSAIDYVFSRESGWNNNAQNPTSSAYGIPQFLNSTWAQYGGRTSDPATQIRDGILYMENRYGSPNGAASFWRQHHWYDNGGWLQPGATLALNGTGKPERIRTHEQESALQRQLSGGQSISLQLDGDAVTALLDGRVVTAVSSIRNALTYN